MKDVQHSKARQFEIVVFFTSFIAATYGFGVYLFPAAVESIRAEIPFTYSTLGAVSGLVQAGFMTSAIAAGLLTLHFGAMPLILGSVAVCALCLAGFAFAPSVSVMAALLVILGGCAVIVWVPMVEVSREVIAPQHQGKALGMISSGTSYGVFVNSLLMVTVLPSEGWRWMWGTAAVIVLALTVVAFVRLLGISKRRGSRGISVQTNSIPLVTRLSLIGRPLALALIGMMFLNGLSCIPFQTYLSPFLQGEAGLSQGEAASVWRVVGFVGMFSGFLLGALADRITVRHAMILTYLILSAACFALVNVPRFSSGALLMFSSIGFGTAFYAIFGLVPAYISQTFGKGEAAIVFSTGNIALGAGGIIGNLLGGLLKDASGTFTAAYLLMGAAGILSAALSFLIPSELEYRRKPKEGATMPNS